MFDTKFMQVALQHAQAARGRLSVPVGAVVVQKGTVISAACNDDPLCVMVDEREGTERKIPVSWPRPWLHAELVAAALACRHLGADRLEECDIYVTLEPCLMCAEALRLLRPRRIIFGAYAPTGGLTSLPQTNRGDWHFPRVIGGIREVECQLLIREYFYRKRTKTSVEEEALF